MSVLIGGGSGFVGRHVTKLLEKNGMKVTWVSRESGSSRITWSELQRNGLPEDCTAVISMSGENILNPTKRWNSSFIEAVRLSRIDRTKALATAICQAKKQPGVFISFSGVGHYKPDPVKEYDEYSPGGNFDFLSGLTKEWEAAAELPTSLGVRQVIFRSGIVLGRDGGIIQQIYWPFFMGLGGRLGSGQQWFPWIHVRDVAGIIMHAILNENVSGILNGVSIHTATNQAFTRAFAAALGRPALFPVPGFALSCIYGPERSKIMLEGQKVIPKRTVELGYCFVYPDLTSACNQLASQTFIK